MGSERKSYIGMIAITVLVVAALGAMALRIDRNQQGDVPSGIDATPAITGNAPDLLVDSRWMMRYGGQVDYIFDLSDRNDYEAGHIPNARHLWWQDAMAQHPNNYGEADRLSDPLPETDVFDRLKLNVPQNARIVLYDNENSARASWLTWVLRSSGYTDVLVLDGGLAAWTGAGGEVTTDVPAPVDGDVELTPTWLETWEIRREPLLEQLDSPDQQIIDTRSAGEQQDTVNGTVRLGHIPGAINIPTAMVMRADGTFKSPEELAEIFRDRGIEPREGIVVYSLFTIDSGRMWMALHIAGYGNARIYQEGYVAWGYNPELPIETGSMREDEPLPTSPAPTPLASPVATPLASPIASPELATPTSARATPEGTEGPTDLTGD